MMIGEGEANNVPRKLMTPPVTDTPLLKNKTTTGITAKLSGPGKFQVLIDLFHVRAFYITALVVDLGAIFFF